MQVTTHGRKAAFRRQGLAAACMKRGVNLDACMPDLVLEVKGMADTKVHVFGVDHRSAHPRVGGSPTQLMIDLAEA